MLEQVLQANVVITGVVFTLESMEISYLVNREQTELVSISRSIEVKIGDDELASAYLELQDYICAIVEEAEVIVRNPPVRQGGGLKTLYRQAQEDADEREQ
jgi:hypothetical protein